MGLIRRVRNPELFQGDLKRRNYFEGWYFKLIDRGRAVAAAVIPGIALDGSPDSPASHAFVQFICGESARYFTYPLGDFSADNRMLRVRIGGSTFTRDGISLDISDEQGAIAGTLRFTDVLPFPKTPLWPGIMGPYGYVPGMECYHGVVSIRHTIQGSLSVDGRALNFDGGSGYVEKDWGRSFPSAWIWLQAGHFPGGEALLFSVADIPWRRSSFRGFFAFLYLDGRLHRFATYTGAGIRELNECGGVTRAVIAGRNGTLEIAARPGPGGLLKAPKNGLMDRIIEETIRAHVEARLLDRSGRVIFEGASPCAGMERCAHEPLLDRISPEN